MVEVRIESKPAFTVIGRNIWVSQNNELFGQFWETCRADGLLEQFRAIHALHPQSVTGSHAIGVSRVEKNPDDRSFYFYIATESETIPADLENELERFTVPAADWAIFRNCGEIPEALIQAEMYAFGQWLPGSPYVHAPLPEIEAYPPGDGTTSGTLCEFWLPVVHKHSITEAHPSDEVHSHELL
ncbi:GyrI-like domain-containing protein [Paenibacillus sp. NFR01]|uniref:GyrI-like domain-containing protein n=1 Tax=Paenibacillus sp. NFR01 TaxID=1566279 RepID=UPI00158743D8|nr:GyrI-like domain-containing protein [Paenibacillus sp. NFR01]